jgi:hypothetical protein
MTSALASSRRAAVFVAAALICVTVDALELEVTEAALRRAISLARGDSRALAAFHRQYVNTVAKGDLQEIEVITELRRAVLATANCYQVGEPETAAVRRLQQVLSPFRGRVSVVAHFRFSPQTALVTLPLYDVAMPSTPGAPAVRPLDLRRTPIYTGEGRSTFLAGADVEAVFDGSQVGQTKRRVGVGLQGKELATVAIDFAAIE